jgi:hypothetical protein
MSYTYDVFISYKRHREWTLWTRDHLQSLLEAYLSDDLGRSPSIFVDEQIEPGADWPQRLGEALGRTRVMVPVFSRNYFASAWCQHELDLMHSRQSKFSGSKLIVPIIGHDGELIPKEIGRKQSYDLSEFRIVDIQRGTIRYQQFSEAVKQLAPHIAAAIASAPIFNDSWLAECIDRFDKIYEAHTSHSTAPATTLTFKPLPLSLPRSPPRVPI